MTIFAAFLAAASFLAATRFLWATGNAEKASWTQTDQSVYELMCKWEREW